MTGSSYYSVEKDASGRSGGTTQAETRIYNERLILSLIRLHGQLSKVELTRLTGLAPQTITTIVNRAADNQLLVRREPRRGGLGQPSVPYALNPAGAYSFGLKIDRRSADIVLVDFVGNVVAFERTAFDYPMPNDVLGFAKSAITRIRRKQGDVPADRIAGLGIASPFQQKNWHELIHTPRAAAEAWESLDIRVELEAILDLPVFLLSDAMVSAGAELMFGAGLGRTDFIYAYVGDVVGGGLVLDHHLFPGANKLAGNLGALPVPIVLEGHTRPTLLNDVASIDALIRQLGTRPEADRLHLLNEWSDLGRDATDWIEGVAAGLAFVARSAVALLDVDNLVIDGAVPVSVRREIAKSVRRHLAKDFLDRPEPFTVLEGIFGDRAPAIGGASVPLLVAYSNDKELLFKD